MSIWRILGFVVMATVGCIFLFAQDGFIVGNIWLVGAILLLWMPEGK